MQGVLTKFEFSTQTTIWFYDGTKFTEGRLVRNSASIPQSSLVENQRVLSPQFINIFNFDLSVLDRIKDPEVLFVTSELRMAWSRQS